MKKDVIILVLKVILVIAVIFVAMYLGINFADTYKSKLDKTKPAFAASEEVNKITGKVTTVLRGKEGVVTALVENREEGAVIDKIDLVIDREKTTITKENKLYKVEDIAVGMEVVTTFEKIEDGYPIKALAKKIEIIK